MSKVLVIDGHPETKNESKTEYLLEYFISNYQTKHPDDEIKIINVYSDGTVPPINDQTLDAWEKQKFGRPMTDDDVALLKKHNETVDQFVSYDKYVFANPMYDHFLPAEMKEYLDVVSVPHKTMKYTANGPVGLLGGKKALHIQAAGGFYHTNNGKIERDFGDAYLRDMMHFYGISDVSGAYIEGTDFDPEHAEDFKVAARQQVDDVLTVF